MRNLAVVADAATPLAVVPTPAHHSPAAETHAAGVTATPFVASVDCLSIAVDPATGSRFSLRGDGLLLCHSAAGSLRFMTGLPTIECEAPEKHKWVQLEYIAESESLFAAHSAGALTLLKLRTSPAEEAGAAGGPAENVELEVELVGNIEGGIEALAWSNDMTILLIVSGAGQLLNLTCPSWQLLGEVHSPAFFTPSSAAEAAAAGEGAGLPSDCRITACWRPDAQFLCVSAVDREKRRRLLRIYPQDLSSCLEGRNEDGSAVTGLHSAVAWSADGALLACGMDVPGKSRVQVAFFETNGLRHRELVLPGALPGQMEVTGLSWNANCDLLAVLVSEKTVAAAAPRQQLSLWHRDNYHWYPKRTIAAPAAGTRAAALLPAPLSAAGEGEGEGLATLPPAMITSGSISSFRWGHREPYQLHLSMQGQLQHTAAVAVETEEGPAVHLQEELAHWQRLHRLDLSWLYSVSEGSSVTVATVEEQNRLQLSPSDLAPVPPPMAYTTLSFLHTPAPAPGSSGGAAAGGAGGGGASFWQPQLQEVVFQPDSSSTPSSIAPAAAPAVTSSSSASLRVATLFSDSSVQLLGLRYHAPVDAKPPKAVPVALATATLAASAVASVTAPSLLSAAAAPSPSSYALKTACGLSGDCGSASITAALQMDSSPSSSASAAPLFLQLSGAALLPAGANQLFQGRGAAASTALSTTSSRSSSSSLHVHVGEAALSHSQLAAAGHSLCNIPAGSVRQLCWLTGKQGLLPATAASHPQQQLQVLAAAASNLSLTEEVSSAAGVTAASSTSSDALVLAFLLPIAGAASPSLLLTALPLPAGASLRCITTVRLPTHQQSQGSKGREAGAGADGAASMEELLSAADCTDAFLHLSDGSVWRLRIQAGTAASSSATAAASSSGLQLRLSCWEVARLQEQVTSLQAIVVPQGFSMQQKGSPTANGETGEQDLLSSTGGVLILGYAQRTARLYGAAVPLQHFLQTAGSPGSTVPPASSSGVAPLSQLLSPACGGAIYHSRHQLMLHILLGPIPSLAYSSTAQLFTHCLAVQLLKELQHHSNSGAQASSAMVAHSSSSSSSSSGGAASSAQHYLNTAPALAVHADRDNHQQAAASRAHAFSQAVAATAAAATAVEPRLLERGSRLVSLVPQTDSLQLQMPRGNCEGIVPRALTLASIRSCLDCRPLPDLGGALALCRKQRVDMNLLCDHCPELLAVGDWLLAAVGQVAGGTLAATVGSASLKKKAAAAMGGDRWDLLLAALDPADTTASLHSSLSSQGPSRQSLAADMASLVSVQGKYLPPPGYIPCPLPPAAVQAAQRLREAALAAVKAAASAAAAAGAGGDGFGAGDSSAAEAAAAQAFAEASGIPSAVLQADPTLPSLLLSSNKVNRVCAALRLAFLRAMLVLPAKAGAGGEAHQQQQQQQHQQAVGVELAPPAAVPSASTASPVINWRHPLSLSIITSYARQAPADLSSLLKTVQAVAAAEASPLQLQWQQEGGAGGGCAALSLHQIAPLLPYHKGIPGLSDTVSPATVTGDAALHHAIVVCDSDVEILYSTALGCYELRLAHTLAQRGQSDPREYLPFLSGLAKLDAPAATAATTGTGGAAAVAAPSSSALDALVADTGLRLGQVRQRWAIDVHLGRWTRALKWLAALAYHQISSSSASSSSSSLFSRASTSTASSSSSSKKELAPLSKAAIAAVLPEEEALSRLRRLLPSSPADVVAAGISSPSCSLLSLIFTQGLYSQALSLMPAAVFGSLHRMVAIAEAWYRVQAAADASSSSGTAASSSSRHIPDAAEVQQAAALSASLLLAASPALSGSVPGSEEEQSKRQALLNIAGPSRRLEGQLDALFRLFCPPGLQLNKLRQAPVAAVEAAVSNLLAQQPPAIDEAFALALIRGSCPDACSSSGGTTGSDSGSGSAGAAAELSFPCSQQYGMVGVPLTVTAATALLPGVKTAAPASLSSAASSALSSGLLPASLLGPNTASALAPGTSSSRLTLLQTAILLASQPSCCLRKKRYPAVYWTFHCRTAGAAAAANEASELGVIAHASAASASAAASSSSSEAFRMAAPTLPTLQQLLEEVSAALIKSSSTAEGFLRAASSSSSSSSYLDDDDFLGGGGGGGSEKDRIPLACSITDAAPLSAAAQLLCTYLQSSRLEDGVQLYCMARQWTAAAAAATAGGRMDLLDTHIIPSLKAAGEAAIADIEAKAAALPAALLALQQCRALQARQPLSNLLGSSEVEQLGLSALHSALSAARAEAEALAAADAAAGGAGDGSDLLEDWGAGHGWAGDSASVGINDSGSVWSDASSVVSGATGRTGASRSSRASNATGSGLYPTMNEAGVPVAWRGAGTAGSVLGGRYSSSAGSTLGGGGGGGAAGGDGASVLSSRTGLTASLQKANSHSSGAFSHLSAASLPQTLRDTRQTLRLPAADGSDGSTSDSHSAAAAVAAAELGGMNALGVGNAGAGTAAGGALSQSQLADLDNRAAHLLLGRHAGSGSEEGRSAAGGAGGGMGGKTGSKKKSEVAQQRAMRKGNGKNAGKQRPGSLTEEKALEAALLQLLPLPALIGSQSSAAAGAAAAAASVSTSSLTGWQAFLSAATSATAAPSGSSSSSSSAASYARNFLWVLEASSVEAQLRAFALPEQANKLAAAYSSFLQLLQGVARLNKAAEQAGAGAGAVEAAVLAAAEKHLSAQQKQKLQELLPAPLGLLEPGSVPAFPLKPRRDVSAELLEELQQLRKQQAERLGLLVSGATGSGAAGAEGGESNAAAAAVASAAAAAALQLPPQLAASVAAARGKAAADPAGLLVAF